MAATGPVANFTYLVPTKLVFGKGQIASLATLVPATARVLLAYGMGSIKKNGVYDQVIAGLKHLHTKPVEFTGIEANPEYATLMRAVAVARAEAIDFILAVGGGSVADGCKFIAAALNWKKTADPWDMLVHMDQEGWEGVAKIPIGLVLTLPATGTESNGNSVVSRKELAKKLFFGHISCHPTFSILDPETTFSLPARQIANGVVDAFVHVMEQYIGHYDVAAVQDELSEGVMRVLVKVGKETLEHPTYKNRADFMWAATQALNNSLTLGVRSDWATHMIGHEITALYGLDHGQTLAIILPEVLRFEKVHRAQKLARLAEKVFGVHGAVDMAEEAIRQIEAFFHSLGVATKLSQYPGCDDRHLKTISERFVNRPVAAEKNITAPEVAIILKASF